MCKLTGYQSFEVVEVRIYAISYSSILDLYSDSLAVLEYGLMHLPNASSSEWVQIYFPELLLPFSPELLVQYLDYLLDRHDIGL